MPAVSKTQPLPDAQVLARPVSPDAAIAFWQQRAKLTDAEAKALGAGVRHRAFYVTGLAQKDLVQSVSDGIQAALQNGETLADFKKRIASVIQREGWHSHRVENIFRTNMQTAYAAGRYAKMQAVKASRPYWRYFTIEDKRRRPSHAVLHGMVYPADHEFWERNYTPNGFRCRCGVQSLSARQVEKLGLEVQQKMPSDMQYTDPVTGMEYPVARPGADDGFRNNVGKDWLAGLDLQKYPDLTPESYDQQRGVASKLPAPVKSYVALGEEIKIHCAHFATNAGIKSVKTSNTSSYLMATYCEGSFMLSSHAFPLKNGSTFNAALELKKAWNKLAARKPLTWNEEYSLESLWHEIIHNRQKHKRMPPASASGVMMEVATQWTARRTYHEMIESLGGKAAYRADIKKNGLGYGWQVKRFDRLLEVLKVKEDDLVPRLVEMMRTVDTTLYLEQVENALVLLSGAQKSTVKKALTELGGRTDFEEILRSCGLVS